MKAHGRNPPQRIALNVAGVALSATEAIAGVIIQKIAIDRRGVLPNRFCLDPLQMWRHRNAFQKKPVDPQVVVDKALK